jgi:hypothetical protein
MNKFFSETLGLGPNWVTTVLGFVTLVMGAISVKPDVVAFLPDNIEGYVVGVANLITLVSGGAFAVKVKSSNVTGGEVPSTHEAEKRVKKDNKENEQIKEDAKLDG